MTGLEFIGLGAGAVAVYEAEQRNGFFATAIETIKHPFSQELTFKKVLALLLLALALMFLWQNILKGYISE